MNMTEQKYNTIIKSIDKLIALASNGKVPDETMGICGNLTSLSEYCCYEIVSQLSPSWEHCVPNKFSCTGNDYPIPENYKQSRWIGDNLIMRLSLLEHIRANLHTFEESNDD